MKEIRFFKLWSSGFLAQKKRKEKEKKPSGSCLINGLVAPYNW